MSALEDIKARLATATPGPWFRDSTTDGGETTENVVARLWDVARCSGGDTHPDAGRAEQAKADADYIAHSPADMAKLIAALEAVEEVMRKLDDIQEHDNVSVNASAHGVACVVRAAIEEELA